MPGALDEAAVGEVIEERRIGPLSRLDFARFSISTDDPNRVHIEEAVAAAAGLPDVIGSGGIVTYLLTDVVTSWAGLESLHSATLRVLAPIFPGTVLLCRAHVLPAKQDGNGFVEVEAHADDESGQRIAEGTFRLVLSG
jgi:acyl dehydratase